MTTLFFYLLQVVIASGILYAYYHFFLRNKKFHQYNRYYILLATIISALIPFLNIPVYFTHEEAKSNLVLSTLSNISVPVYEADSVVITPSSLQSWFTWQNVLYSLYILIATLVLMRIILSLRKITLIIKNNPVEKIEKIRFVNTEEPGTPFSFFRWLFWNKKIELQSEKGEQIFRHELFHIEKKHSLDILFMELLTSIFWINPFFHLMKKELKAIHEFLADQFAVSENKHWEYAELLLMQALNTQNHLTNPFFHNQIKRRIAMLTTSSKPGHQYLRKVLVLPVAAIVLALFAFKYKEINLAGTNQTSVKMADTLPEVKSYYSKISLPGNVLEFRADTFIINRKEKINSFSDLKNALIIINNEKRNLDSFQNKAIFASMMKVYPKNDASAIQLYGEAARNGAIIFEDAHVKNLRGSENNNSDTLIPDKKIFEKVEVQASFPGGVQEWRRYLERNLGGFDPAVNGAPKGAYSVIIQFVTDLKGKISNVRALTNYGYGMEDTAIKIIKRSPNWIPAIQNGHKVKAYRNQPITFVVSEGADSLRVVENPGSTIKDKSKYPDLKGKLILIDGVEYSNLSQEELDKKILPQDIFSIEVIKGAAASSLAKYGEKGKNGVIIITSKKNKDVNANELKLSKTNSNENKIFEKTEIPPSFPGGIDGWRKYLQATLANYNPTDSGANAGTYTVMAQFIVDQDGSLRDIKALTHFGHGMEGKVIDMLKNSPKWEPAIQNGRKVSAYVKQPVTFVVQDKDESTQTNPSLKEVVVTGYASGKQKINPENNQENNSLKEITVVGYSNKSRKTIFPKEELDQLSSIYPNPSTKTITIPFKSETGGKGEIRIYDETGNLKLSSSNSFSKGSNTLNINISSLAKGVYIVQLIDANKKMANVYKLIKQ